MVCHLLRGLGRDVVQKVDVFVGVEGAHNLGRRPLGALQQSQHTSHPQRQSTHQNMHLVEHAIRRD